ncbi:DsbE family thiol:disulfide interchange protein [Oricola sp.]|uniref:DsbE family thiol:disulfide interchange protein n=1 Tax=Oricola sp. TaxID=1979950 RepID=UPI0025E93D51|nr:DsbE family thiol:disulfide interchange protein [Oricola sp.]MCI5075532.1 DsbE family thiol:disulfide interchange protein [Oricola sp.]
MSDTAEKPEGRKLNPAVFLPITAFVVLVVLFAVLMFRPGRDARVIPSMLIGNPAPELALPAIPGLNGADGNPLPAFDPATFDGKPVLVNVWASWCVPCRQEHPLLMALSQREGVTIAGLNYKDKTPNAIQFLLGLGNPYDQVGTDQSGRAAIEWGVYGVPESFVVGADGTVLHKHTGPLTPEAIENDILPLLQGESPS